MCVAVVTFLTKCSTLNLNLPPSRYRLWSYGYFLKVLFNTDVTSTIIWVETLLNIIFLSLCSFRWWSGSTSCPGCWRGTGCPPTRARCPRAPRPRSTTPCRRPTRPPSPLSSTRFVLGQCFRDIVSTPQGEGRISEKIVLGTFFFSFPTKYSKIRLMLHRKRIEAYLVNFFK